MLDLSLFKPYSKSGEVITCDNGYVYAKTEDEIIFSAQRLLKTPLVPPSLGSHITICYETEVDILPRFLDWVPSIAFDLIRCEQLIFGQRRYLAFIIESPDIVRLRKKLGLPEKLTFRGIKLPLHLTIGKILV